MKLFDKYFQPYAEYCLRTTFSEDKLKDIFKKELASYNNLFAVFKSGFQSGEITFFRKHDPLKLHPGMGGRNSLRGEISIRCKKAEYSHGTILHITIAPPDSTLLFKIMLGFCVVVGIAALSAGVWFIIFHLILTVGAMFMILAICRSAAENEVQNVCRDFETLLRKLEHKYQRHQ